MPWLARRASFGLLQRVALSDRAPLLRRWQSWLDRLAVRVLDRAQTRLSTIGVSLITIHGEARADQETIYKQLHGHFFPARPVQAIQKRLKKVEPHLRTVEIARLRGVFCKQRARFAAPCSS
eukprot:6067910-Pyramimonas_sp.AAC.1